MNKLFAVVGVGLLAGNMMAQDKGKFVVSPSNYYDNNIVGAIKKFEAAEPTHALKFGVDFSGTQYPTDPAKYTKVWYNSPISQGNTGTCWCFSTTSFYEAEIKRTTGKDVDLSEMYTVYWEYVERAKYFVEHRGEMTLGEGSETNAVARMMEKYGVVPQALYTGKLPGQEHHNHEPMFNEIRLYLEGVKERNAWNEIEVVATVKAILEHYMGKIPTEVLVDGKKMTPVAYMKSVGIVPGDYLNFMSLKQAEYWEKSVYNVPDNWWKSDNYNNVPLDDFMQIITDGIKNGYSFSIGGDVSEPGFDKQEQVAIIPSFDIPSDAINDDARQLRFSNGATTDDHAMHLVGYKQVNGKYWFLIKDSGSGSRNCGEMDQKFGYYFMHEDYIKLKMMSFTVHKDAVTKYAAKIQL